MAYSSNPVTVERLMPFLAPLAEGRETHWRTAPNKSRWLAYKIREALAIAREHPERFPALAETDYRIEIVSSREVRAVPKGAVEVEVFEPDVAPAGRAAVETQASGLEQIKNLWYTTPGTEKLYFPNAGLSPEELLELYEWCQGPGLMFFENTGAITLMQHDPETAPFAWDPSDLETDNG